MSDPRALLACGSNGGCPRCGGALRTAARFCPTCGFALPHQGLQATEPGQIPHPVALAPPTGFSAVTNSANLWFTWESALGGKPLIGTEGFRVTLFNAGHDLFNVEVEVVGGGAGSGDLRVAREVPELLRGTLAELEIPSWEVNQPLQALEISLKSARLTPFA